MNLSIQFPPWFEMKCLGMDPRVPRQLKHGFPTPEHHWTDRRTSSDSPLVSQVPGSGRQPTQGWGSKMELRDSSFTLLAFLLSRLSSQIMKTNPPLLFIPPFSFVCVGEGRLLQRRICYETKPLAYLHLLGPFSRPHEYYCICDLFFFLKACLTSRASGSPLRIRLC